MVSTLNINNRYLSNVFYKEMKSKNVNVTLEEKRSLKRKTDLIKKWFEEDNQLIIKLASEMAINEFVIHLSITTIRDYLDGKLITEV